MSEQDSRDPLNQRIVPFDSEKHAGLGVDPVYYGEFVASRHVVTLNLVEFFYASHHYPLAFVQNEKGEMGACAATATPGYQSIHGF